MWQEGAEDGAPFAEGGEATQADAVQARGAGFGWGAAGAA